MQQYHFHLKKSECPAFYMQYKWTIIQLEGFLNTWSALQKFITINNYNPVDELIDRYPTQLGHRKK